MLIGVGINHKFSESVFNRATIKGCFIRSASVSWREKQELRLAPPDQQDRKAQTLLLLG